MRLDVLLVHLESFYNMDTNQVNLGVLYIATNLAQHGLSAQVMSTMDLYYLTDEQLEQILTGLNPTLVGFYTMSDTIHQVAGFARKIKGWCPNCRTLAGGPLASGKPQELTNYFDFDYVIVGEGELATLALAQELCSKPSRQPSLDTLREIPGLYYKDAVGVLQAGKPAQHIMDLDALPNPNRDLVPRALRLNISAGRGCPNACTYCFQAVHGKGYRFRSAEHLAQEIIANLEQHPYRAFDIIDDTFIADPERALRFCQILSDYRRQTQRDFAWYCEARVDTFAAVPELLPALQQAGLVRLQVGIESGDAKTLQRYGKRLDLAALERLCEQVNSLGSISIFGNFIIGGPYETEETIQKSLDLAKRLLHLAPGLFECTSSFLTPFPETPINTYPERFGVKIFDREFLTGVSLNECCCETPTLNAPALRRLRYEFTLSLLEEMIALVPEIPKKRILQHFHWQKKYGVSTRWLAQVFQALPAVKEYFTFYDSPRFCELSAVPEERLEDYTPMRTLGTLQFDQSNWEDFLLNSDYAPLALTDPLEKDVYALAAGKLTVRQLCEQLRLRHSLPENMTLSAIKQQIVLPMLKRLEDHYELIMHE